MTDLTGPSWSPSEMEDAADPDVILRERFVSWVDEHFRIIEYPGRGIAWCSQWWEHPEALARIRAMWQAYLAAEVSMGQGEMGAMSSWWIHHWDRHTPILFDKNGPFRYCESPGRHLALLDGDNTTTLILDVETPRDDAPLL